jgi:hypothetical protein
VQLLKDILGFITFYKRIYFFSIRKFINRLNQRFYFKPRRISVLELISSGYELTKYPINQVVIQEKGILLGGCLTGGGL